MILDPGAASVDRSELRDEGQPDPGSRDAGVGVAPGEELEDRFPFLLLDAETTVVDGDHHETVVPFDAGDHIRSGRRVFERIREQVLDLSLIHI